MRINEQISTHEIAGRALGGSSQAADYATLIGQFWTAGRGGSTDGAGDGLGLDSRVRREMSDPLGLATEQAAVAPSESPLFSSPPGTHTDARQPVGAQGQASSSGGAMSSGRLSAAHAGLPEDSSQPTVEDTPRSNGTRGAATSGASASRADESAAQPVVAGPANHVDRGGDASGARSPRAGADGGVAALQAAGGRGSGANLTGNSQPGGNLPGITAMSNQAKNDRAGPTGEAARASSPQQLRTEQAEIAPQVAKGLASLVLKDGGRAQIQLRPEALGRVDVDLAVEQGIVRATLSAENETARELLRDQLDQLRSLLEQRGLRVESLEVSDADGERGLPADANDRRGGRWMSAQDEPRGTGTDAGHGSGPPGDGGEDPKERGGAPARPAERVGTQDGARSVEPDAARQQTDRLAVPRWDPGVMSVRLDTMA